MKAIARFAWLILSESERTAFLEAVRPGVSPEHYERIRAMTEAFPELLKLFEERGTSLMRVLKIAFGAPTEKTANVCPPAETVAPTPPRPRLGEKDTGVAEPKLTPGPVASGCLIRGSRQARCVRIVVKASCVCSPNQPRLST